MNYTSRKPLTCRNLHITHLGMTGEELKMWREARSLTQAQLGEALGMHRDSIVRHEKSDQVPRTIELSLLALTLGVKRYAGREIVLNQFKLELGTVRGSQPNELIDIEQLNSLQFGRGKTANRGDIAAWLADREGIQMNANGLYATDDANLAFEIKMKWF